MPKKHTKKRAYSPAAVEIINKATAFASGKAAAMYLLDKLITEVEQPLYHLDAVDKLRELESKQKIMAKAMRILLITIGARENSAAFEDIKNLAELELGYESADRNIEFNPTFDTPPAKETQGD